MLVWGVVVFGVVDGVGVGVLVPVEVGVLGFVGCLPDEGVGAVLFWGECPDVLWCSVLLCVLCELLYL